MRLSSTYFWIEKTASSYGFFLLIPTFIFPLFIFILYWKKLERTIPLPDLNDNMDLDILKYLYCSTDIEKIQKSAYTASKHAQFMNRYGALL